MLAVALPHYEFIRVSGADTVTFLQGQLSCDVTALSAELSQNGALCNLKGRVIADFRLLRQGEDCLLQTQAGMADIILTVLNKYAVFSKVDLQLESGLIATGLLGSGAEDAVSTLLGDPGDVPHTDNAVIHGEGICAVAVPGPDTRFEIWCTEQRQAELSEQLKQWPAGELRDWQRQDFRAGLIHVTPELSEQYTPQLLNYDLSGVINFKKGCYTGQEVVARMFYRGKAKKRLHLFQSEQAWAQDDGPGDFTLIAQAAPTASDPDGHLLLAVTSIEQDSNELLTDNGGSLQKLKLPYVA